MQSKINNKVQFGQALNPLNDVAKILIVDNSSDLKDVSTKMDRLKKLWDDGFMDFELIRYLPGMEKISRQGQIFSVLPQRAYASLNRLDLRAFEFNILLEVSTAANFNNMHLCIPMQINKKTNVVADIDDDLIVVNNFCAHFIKEIICLLCLCGDNVRILPTSNTVGVYRYSDAMLKQMSEKALETYENTLLYSKKPVKLPSNNDRRLNNDDDANNRTDHNLTD